MSPCQFERASAGARRPSEPCQSRMAEALARPFRRSALRPRPMLRPRPLGPGTSPRRRLDERQHLWEGTPWSMTSSIERLLAAATSPAALREAIERHRAALVEQIGAGEDGLALGRSNARFLDACLRTRFQAAGPPSAGMALAAVGSLGRGAVALRSDADLVLVVDPRAMGTKDATQFVEALLYPLWDATLPVG